MILISVSVPDRGRVAAALRDPPMRRSQSGIVGAGDRLCRMQRVPCAEEARSKSAGADGDETRHVENANAAAVRLRARGIAINAPRFSSPYSTHMARVASVKATLAGCARSCKTEEAPTIFRRSRATFIRQLGKPWCRVWRYLV